MAQLTLCSTALCDERRVICCDLGGLHVDCCRWQQYLLRTVGCCHKARPQHLHTTTSIVSDVNDSMQGLFFDYQQYWAAQ